ncbi:hypothetical protein V8F20_006430 [Naviculisporaceae sp. PSN 640]
MKFAITIITLLAGIAMATPAAMPVEGKAEALDVRGSAVDCKKCGCSSAESCTFDCCQ